MQSLLNVLRMGAYGVGALALGCFLLLVIAYRRNERREHARLQRTRHDIADMAILFQTMRDIIAQQKHLAREFNEELERKMDLVKQILARGMEKNERLYEKQQALAKQLEETHSELQSLQRQVAFLRENLSGQDAPPLAPPIPLAITPKEEATAERPAQPLPWQEAEAAAETGLATPEQAQPESAGEFDTDTILSEWLRPSGKRISIPRSLEESAPAPEKPEDAEAARQAFRALLNMPPQEPPPAKSEPRRISANTAAPEADQGDNGGNAMALLHKRVREYSEAGMTVPEIARELGIGKGEIRLILSLGRSAKRP